MSKYAVYVTLIFLNTALVAAAVILFRCKNFTKLSLLVFLVWFLGFHTHIRWNI